MGGLLGGGGGGGGKGAKGMLPPLSNYRGGLPPWPPSSYAYDICSISTSKTRKGRETDKNEKKAMSLSLNLKIKSFIFYVQ